MIEALEEFGTKTGFILLLSFTFYTTFASFAYALKSANRSKIKENIIVSLCAFISLACSVLYSVIGFLYPKTGYMCVFAQIVYKASIVLSKCFCNLIFAYRYKEINRRSSVLAANRAYKFSIGIITISIILLVFDQVYFFLVFKPSNLMCIQTNVISKIQTNLIVKIVMLGGFLVLTVLQTVILVEIIKPIYEHFTRRLSISNNDLRATLYRVVSCTLVFCLSDFGLVIVQILLVVYYNRPFGIVATVNVIINSVSLICSYSDYRERLFPFRTRTQPTA